MSHTFLKVASVTLLTSAIVLFAVMHNAGTNLPSAPRLPQGTFWNLDAGFGDSELTFSDASHYTDGGIGAVSVEGSYTVSQNQIVFVEYGPADAPCLHIPGTYQWSLKRRLLALKEIHDGCPTRQFDWQTGAWVEQSEVSFAH